MRVEAMYAKGQEMSKLKVRGGEDIVEMEGWEGGCWDGKDIDIV